MRESPKIAGASARAGQAATRQRKPRKSSNRGGLPLKDLVGLIDAALAKIISVDENGQRRGRTVFEALLLKLWIMEMSGDASAMRTRLRFEKLARDLGVKRSPQVIIEGGLPVDYVPAVAGGHHGR